VYPHRIQPDSVTAEAVALLRQTLAAQPDNSVVLVMVGHSTNLARLLDSATDAVSPLPGHALVAQKVKWLSMMAGHFTNEGPAGAGEYNIIKDIAAAQKVLQDWPSPIYISPYELGVGINYPEQSIERDYAYVPHHPIAEAYRLYQKFPYNRPTWDLTSVLFAVHPDGGYFSISEPGKIVVEATGKTTFTTNPRGRHFVLSADAQQKVRALEAMVLLSSQPPVGLAHGSTIP